MQPHPTYLARTRPEDPSGTGIVSKAHIQRVLLFCFCFFLSSESDSAEGDDLCIFLFCLCRRKQRSLSCNSVQRNSSALWTLSYQNQSSVVTTRRTMTNATWSRQPAPSSSQGSHCFIRTAMAIWKTSRKSQSTSSTAPRNGMTGKVSACTCIISILVFYVTFVIYSL